MIADALTVKCCTSKLNSGIPITSPVSPFSPSSVSKTRSVFHTFAVILLLSLSLPLFADDFQSANALYEKGEFTQALPLYEKLVAANPKEAAYHYNLGNAFLKTGRVGRGVASYLRAFRLSPRDNDIRYNLTFTLARAGDELIPPGIPYSVFLLAYSLSGEELSGLFWLSFWSFCVLSGLYLLSSPSAPSPRSRGEGRGEGLSSAAVIALCFFAFFGTWRWMRATIEPAETAVTIRSDAELRNGPGTNFSVGYTLPEGRRLAVLGRKGDWYEVAAPKEGVKGWIETTSVEKI